MSGEPMSLEQKAGVSDADLQKAIVELLQKSEKPLTVKDILKGLPRMYKVPEPHLQQLIADLSDRSEIHSWGKIRNREGFSIDRPERGATAALLAALTEPLSRAKLQENAAKKLPGLAKPLKDKLLKQLIPELLRSGEAVKLPRTSERVGPVPAKISLEEALARLVQDYEGVTRERVEQAFAKAVPAQDASLEDRIRATLLTVEPQAKEGALASLQEVRRRMTPPVSKEEFDEAVMRMVRTGALSVHEFMGHLQVSEEERAQLVFDGQEYYGGVTIRRR